MHFVRKAAAIFFLLVPMAIWTPASAYDLQPIVVQLTPNGAGSAQSVIITNTHEEPIAIEVSAYHRIQRPDGSEEQLPEDDDIIISPPQLVIAPGASQAVRVRWIGDPEPDHELAFRVVTEQLPIALATEQRDDFTANVSVNYRYEAALYVTPSSAAPAARIDRAAPVTAEDGTQMLEIDIVSEGTRRASLEAPTVVLTPASGDAVTMDGEAVTPLNQLVILTGSRRTVRLPWPEGMPVGAVQAELRTRYIVLN